MYLFPAGMVELAARSGLELTRFTSIRDPQGTWSWALATHQLIGFASDTVHGRPRAPQLITELLLPILGPRTVPWVGETNIYIFERRQAPGR